ncbi:hypothetical protein BSKO_12773 [Bryopsis sp. KO-2023]|nr:hypothetical protein BSKO_12773 [Bryopsis sp. KO-2023]
MDLEQIPYLELVLGFTVIVYFCHSYLELRQYKALCLKSPPKSVASLFKDEEYEKAKSYSLDKWWFGMVKGVYDVIESLAMLGFGFLPFAWDLSSKLVSRIGFWTDSEIFVTLVFVFGFSMLSMVMELPWSLYGTFVLEEKHGFNKQTKGVFFGDRVKQILIGLLLGPPIIGAVVYILNNSGPYLPIYLWGFMFALGIFLMTIYPVCIAPLFNKFEPLEEGSLRDGIETLAASLKFPLTRLYQMDGSKRSAHSNAFMYGFFNNKRIVLFDTLIEQCNEKQVVAVLAHELGHWKLSHTVKMFVGSQIIVFVQFLLFAYIRNSNALMASFGFVDTQPAFVALILYQLISSPMDEVVSFGSNIVSRMFEFQADEFAVNLGHSEKLSEALVIMQKENKGALNVDKWYSAYHYSHPPLPERLEAITTNSKKTK